MSILRSHEDGFRDEVHEAEKSGHFPPPLEGRNDRVKPKIWEEQLEDRSWEKWKGPQILSNFLSRVSNDPIFGPIIAQKWGYKEEQKFSPRVHFWAQKLKTAKNGEEKFCSALSKKYLQNF